MNRWNLSKFGLAAGLVIAAPALADTPIWSVEEAQAALAQDDVLLLDIRSDDEWAETGIAKGALPVSMHAPSFGALLQKLTSKAGHRRVALICATGGRSQYVTDVLAQNGIQVIDVSEGMMGNGRGAGWIKKGLPMVDHGTANGLLETMLAQ